MKSQQITLDYTNIEHFIEPSDLENIKSDIERAHNLLVNKNGVGNDFLGWLDLPFISESSIKKIITTAEKVRNDSDDFVCIGIGGSYLGAKAIIEAIKPTNEFNIYFAGHHIDTNYLANLLLLLKNKKFYINVISKSGTTLEPAISFRLLKKLLEENIGKEEACKRIIATTDIQNGALKKMSDIEKYTTFVIPDNVGGRFSILTPVGLLPIAISGIDIHELIQGAKDMANSINNVDIFKNDSYMYAALRTILYRKNRTVEILANFNPALHNVAEWWKQLFGESEGKDQKGIFPASVNFTTDLHSLGQYIQDGLRNIFETFLIVKKSNSKITIPFDNNNFDGLNYIADKDLDEINFNAFKGTAQAHKDGNVPNMTLELPELTPYYLGQLIFFFEKAVAISGYMLNVNPFNQPGVEAYKKNMFELLGRP